MDLPQRLAEGVAALRDGDAEGAVDLLGPVATDEELAAATDLRDIRARVCTLYAQALLAAGRPSEARHPLQDARDLLTDLGDPDGLAAVEELQSTLSEALSDAFQAQARRRTLRDKADADVDTILADVPPARHAPVLVEHATACLDVGRTDTARELAERALSAAEAHEDLRHQVLSLLVLARSSDTPAEPLEEARRRADAADAFNLLSFVVKTAEQVGVTLQDAGGHA